MDDGASAPDTVYAKLSARFKNMEPLVLVWWCFTLSILFSTAARFSTNSTSLTTVALVAIGSGGCAWFWLLSRLLFRRTQNLSAGVLSVVPIVMFIEASGALLSPSGPFGVANEAGRVMGNAASMTCMAAIVFIFIEVLQGFQQLRSAAERRFRIVYITVLSLLMMVTILWVRGASTDSIAPQWIAAVLTFCAMFAVVGSRFALHYRLRNPQHATARDDATDCKASERLAQRILAAIQNESLLTTCNLKVSDFADQIEEQEYKVTRCITSRLQFRNFNHFLNSYRVDRAKHIFNDPAKRHLSIATVAYDCGFNSLGPFNRAFRQHTGMTPREFRQSQAVT